jgi:hypothetical protein
MTVITITLLSLIPWSVIVLIVARMIVKRLKQNK